MAQWVRTILFTVPPGSLAEAREGHREHLRRLRASGKLRAAGELGPGDGCLEIYEAADRHEAETIAKLSPIVAEGLGTWMLREWTETVL